MTEGRSLSPEPTPSGVQVSSADKAIDAYLALPDWAKQWMNACPPDGEPG